MNLKLIKYTNTPGTFEAEWLDDEKTVRVIAYTGDQIDLFRADVAQYGGEVDEALLAEVAAEWVPPAPALVQIPQVVTMRQARLALLSAGKLSQVDAVIDSLTEPHKSAARIEWDYSSEVQRNKPFVVQIGAALGLTGEQLDQLFIEASKL